MLWTNKYQPKLLSEVVDQKKVIGELMLFVKDFSRANKKAYLIAGPPGCGKTAVVYALASELNMELIEMNASDFRNKDMIDSNLKPATMQASIFGRKKMILIDEVDMLSGQKDRGGAGALAEIVSETRFPIIMTANDAYSDKLKSLRKYCTVASLRKPNYRSVASLLAYILHSENIACDMDALLKIALVNDGDVRGSINDLQTIAEGKKALTIQDVLASERFKDETILEAMKLIFKSFDMRAAMLAVDSIKEEYDTLSLWLYDIIPKEYVDPSAICDAYRCLSDANIFQSRILHWQHWRFLVYVQALMVAGVQQAKSRASMRYVPYQRPFILLKLWQRAARRKKLRALAERASPVLHCSSRVLQSSFMPFYEVIKTYNKALAKNIDYYLGI